MSTYWIVTDCDDQANDDYWAIAVHAAGGYSGGNIAKFTDGGATWSPNSTPDMLFKVYGIGDPLNMTLVSNSNVAIAQPDEGRVVIFEQDVDSITLNTDLKVYASRDGGTTYTQITLADEGNYAASQQILAGTVDISGQPSGTSMKYKIETLNNKDLKIHGTGLHWS